MEGSTSMPVCCCTCAEVEFMDWLWSQDCTGTVGDYSEVSAKDLMADQHVLDFAEHLKARGQHAVAAIAAWDADPYNGEYC